LTSLPAPSPAPTNPLPPVPLTGTSSTNANSSTSASSPAAAGMLLIRVGEARNLAYQSIPIPSIGSSKDLNTSNAANPGGDKNSLLDKTPYCVVEFDKNDFILPAKEGGLETKNAVWHQRSHL